MHQGDTYFNGKLTAILNTNDVLGALKKVHLLFLSLAPCT